MSQCGCSQVPPSIWLPYKLHEVKNGLRARPAAHGWTETKKMSFCSEIVKMEKWCQAVTLGVGVTSAKGPGCSHYGLSAGRGATHL